MARLVSYRANRRGMRDLINSEGVDNMLSDRGDAVAQVAQAAYDANPPQEGEFVVEVLNDSASDSDRSRVAVWADHPAALAYEANHRILGSALSAAKGL